MSQVKVSAIAAQYKTTELAVKEALITLGFKISYKQKQYWVNGTVHHALLNDGTETNAVEASKELHEYAAQYSKSIQEIAAFIKECKQTEIATEGAGGSGTSVTPPPLTDSTITSEIELDELEPETKLDIETSLQAAMQQAEETNRTEGDILGVIIEADRIKKITEGRRRAWENPRSRAALTGLINQGSSHTLDLLLGKPQASKDSAQPRMKLTSLSSLIEKGSNSPKVEETIQVIPIESTNSPENSIKTLALPAGSTNNGKKP